MGVRGDGEEAMGVGHTAIGPHCHRPAAPSQQGPQHLLTPGRQRFLTLPYSSLLCFTTDLHLPRKQAEKVACPGDGELGKPMTWLSSFLTISFFLSIYLLLPQK